MLSWHGQADNLVPTQALVGYRDRVENKNNRVDDFYRLFLLPGVAHCGAGNGPVPTDDMGALVTWVEKGPAPATLAAAHTNADGATVTRNVCAYPKVARYTGHGSPSSAANFRCV